MRVEKFDFRRLFDEWDDSLEGKRCIMSDSIDGIFDAVEESLDDGEIVEHGKETNNLPFYSNKEEACFYYAYVLDEDFVGSDLHMVQELNSIVNYHNKNLTKRQFFFLSDLLDYMRSNYESRKV